MGSYFSQLFSPKTASAPALAAMDGQALHPFYPLGVEIVNYLANDKDALTLLTIFLAGWVVILALTWWGVSKTSPQLKVLDKWIVLWFFLSKDSQEDIQIANNDRDGQLGRYTSSLKDTSPSTTTAWEEPPTCSVSSGRNMHYRTRDT